MLKTIKLWYRRVHFLSQGTVTLLMDQIARSLGPDDTITDRTLRVWAYLLFGGPQLPTIHDLVSLAYVGSQPLSAFLLDHLVLDQKFLNTLTRSDLERLYFYRGFLTTKLILEIVEESPITLDCKIWKGFLLHSIVEGEVRLANLNLFSLSLERLSSLHCPLHAWANDMWRELFLLDFYFAEAGDWGWCGPLGSYLRRLHTQSPWLLKYGVWNNLLGSTMSEGTAALMPFLRIYEVYMVSAEELTVRDAEEKFRQQLEPNNPIDAENFMRFMDYILALVHYTYDDKPTEGSRILHKFLKTALENSYSKEGNPISCFVDRNFLYLLQFWLKHQGTTVSPTDVEYQRITSMAFAIILRHLGPSGIPRLDIMGGPLRVISDSFERLAAMDSTRTSMSIVGQATYTITFSESFLETYDTDVILEVLRAIAFAALKVPMHVSLLHQDTTEDPSLRELEYYMQYWVKTRWPGQKIVVNVLCEPTLEKTVEDHSKEAPPSPKPSLQLPSLEAA